MNEEIKKIAEACGDDWDSTQQRDKDFLEKFYHATRAALMKELLAGVGEPDGLWIYKEYLLAWQEHDRESFDAHKGRKLETYTKEQVAAAVLRSRVPLSDEQIEEIWYRVIPRDPGVVAFARAIEAAHGIKEQP